MSGHSNALSLLALLCGALAMPADLAAQCRLCDTPVTERTDEDQTSRIQLEVQALLDFDQVILLQSGGRGTARINPDGSGASSGSVGMLSPRAMVGSVVVRGEPGKMVQLGLPTEIMLYGLRGGTIRLTRILSDVGTTPRLDSQGQLQFRFGGELQIEGEVEGDYRGDVPLTVDYL
jgi:hypothetical protein